ncbi:MAG TPA: hypothetical protein DD381_09000 [Lentisphaeria bacterium]|nr:MAG: hypothetical protein A2X47_07860 [Lentisphaerae bacterium GWF2_38_69]HBM16459.1 hypothetical protein [Lentisphaeria bacterium]
MQNYIHNFQNYLGYDLPGFRDGVIVALSGLLAFIIILKILGFIFFRRNSRKAYGLYVESERGQLYISRQAIADLVKSKEIEVPGLTVYSTHLLRKRKTYSVKIVAELNDKDGIFPELVMSLQKKVLNSLNENLGVDSINKVDIELKRVNSPVTV